MYPFIVFAIFAFAIAAAWHDMAFDAASEARLNKQQSQAQNFANFAVALHEAVATPFFDHDEDVATAPVRAFAFSRDFIAHSQGGKIIYDERKHAITNKNIADNPTTTTAYTEYANLFQDFLRDLRKSSATAAQAPLTNTASPAYLAETDEFARKAPIEGLIQTLFGCSSYATPGLSVSAGDPAQSSSQLCGFNTKAAAADTNTGGPAAGRYGYAIATHILPWADGLTIRAVAGDPPTLSYTPTPTLSDPTQLTEYSAKIISRYDPKSGTNAERATAINDKLLELYQEYETANAQLRKFRAVRRDTLFNARQKLRLPEGVYVRAWLGCTLEGGINAANALATDPNFSTIPDDVYSASSYDEGESANYRRRVQRLCGATKTTNPLALIVWLETEDGSGGPTGQIIGLDEGAVHAELQKLLPATTRLRFGIGRMTSVVDPNIPTSTTYLRTVADLTPASPTGANRRGIHQTVDQPAAGLGRAQLLGFPTPDGTPRGILPRQDFAAIVETGLTANLPLRFTSRVSGSNTFYDGRPEAPLAFYSVFPIAEGFDATDTAFRPSPDPQVVSNESACSGGASGWMFQENSVPNTLLCMSLTGLTDLQDQP